LKSTLILWLDAKPIARFIAFGLRRRQLVRSRCRAWNEVSFRSVNAHSMFRALEDVRQTRMGRKCTLPVCRRVEPLVA